MWQIEFRTLSTEDGKFLSFVWFSVGAPAFQIGTFCPGLQKYEDGSAHNGDREGWRFMERDAIYSGKILRTFRGGGNHLLS